MRKLKLFICAVVAFLLIDEGLHRAFGAINGWVTLAVWVVCGGVAAAIDILSEMEEDALKERQNKGNDAPAEIVRQIAALMTVKERLKEGK